MKGFGSDNHASVHPELMQTLFNCNTEHAPSYGTDDWSIKAEQELKKIFGTKSESFFVFNGTAANVLSLRAICQPWQSVLCTDVSHINVDECGAPEFLAGVKLISLPSKNGKFQIEELKKTMTRKGDQHFCQIKAISITQPTELGTCYSKEELKSIIAWARSEGLRVHIDGARLYNAAFFLNSDLFEITGGLGADVLSLGGTKNGFLFGEAVIFFDPHLCKEFKYIRKQAGQLPSKTRFIACQFEYFFSNQLWKKIAQKSCEMAELLSRSLGQFPEVHLTQPRQSNAVFAIFPRQWIKSLRETAFFYVWDEQSFECRLMCSWDTELQDIEKFISKIKELREQK